MIRSARGSSALLAVVIFASALPLRADDATLAETLFQEGKKLMQKGDYAAACPKLAESQRLDPGGGTILALGLCHEKEGKTASAWTELNEALAIATKDGQPARVKTAKEHLAKLEGRLSRVTLKVPSGDAIEGFVLSLDGEKIPKEAWGTAIPVDPGAHAIVAIAPQKKPWNATVEIAEGEQREVAVDLLADDPGALVETSPPIVTTTTTNTTATSAPMHDVSPGTGQRTIGWVAIGTGVVGLGVGVFFGYRALAKRKDSDAGCPTDDSCTPEGKSLNDQAKTAAWISDAGFGIGLVGVALGTYLVLTAPKDQAVHVAPAVSTTSAGFSITGAF